MLHNLVAQRTLNVVNLLLCGFGLAVLARHIPNRIPLLKACS